MNKAEWANTSIIKEDIISYTRLLKEQSSKNIALLGSGSVLTQFAEHNLIDEYQIMIDPVAIGAGIPLLNGVRIPIQLELISSRAFKSGTVLLCYKPLAT